MVRLDLLTVINAPVERCFDLARSIELHLLGAEQTGERAVYGTTSGLIGPGEFVEWEARHFGVKQRLAAKITAFKRPTYFQDTMIRGVFRFLEHDHHFRKIEPEITEMRDLFSFAAPLPVFGVVAETLFLKRYLERFLLERNRVLKQAAESDQWKTLLPEPV